MNYFESLKYSQQYSRQLKNLKSVVTKPTNTTNTSILKKEKANPKKPTTTVISPPVTQHTSKENPARSPSSLTSPRYLATSNSRSTLLSCNSQNNNSSNQITQAAAREHRSNVTPSRNSAGAVSSTNLTYQSLSPYSKANQSKWFTQRSVLKQKPQQQQQPQQQPYFPQNSFMSIDGSYVSYSNKASTTHHLHANQTHQQHLIRQVFNHNHNLRSISPPAIAHSAPLCSLCKESQEPFLQTEVSSAQFLCQNCAAQVTETFQHSLTMKAATATGGASSSSMRQTNRNASTPLNQRQLPTQYFEEESPNFQQDFYQDESDNMTRQTEEGNNILDVPQVAAIAQATAANHSCWEEDFDPKLTFEATSNPYLTATSPQNQDINNINNEQFSEDASRFAGTASDSMSIQHNSSLTHNPFLPAKSSIDSTQQKKQTLLDDLSEDLNLCSVRTLGCLQKLSDRKNEVLKFYANQELKLNSNISTLLNSIQCELAAAIEHLREAQVDTIHCFTSQEQQLNQMHFEIDITQQDVIRNSKQIVESMQEAPFLNIIAVYQQSLRKYNTYLQDLPTQPLALSKTYLIAESKDKYDRLIHEIRNSVLAVQEKRTTMFGNRTFASETSTPQQPNSTSDISYQGNPMFLNYSSNSNNNPIVISPRTSANTLQFTHYPQQLQQQQQQQQHAQHVQQQQQFMQFAEEKSSNELRKRSQSSTHSTQLHNHKQTYQNIGAIFGEQAVLSDTQPQNQSPSKTKAEINLPYFRTSQEERTHMLSNGKDATLDIKKEAAAAPTQPATFEEIKNNYQWMVEQYLVSSSQRLLHQPSPKQCLPKPLSTQEICFKENVTPNQNENNTVTYINSPSPPTHELLLYQSNTNNNNGDTSIQPLSTIVDTQLSYSPSTAIGTRQQQQQQQQSQQFPLNTFNVSDSCEENGFDTIRKQANLTSNSESHTLERSPVFASIEEALQSKLVQTIENQRRSQQEDNRDFDDSQDNNFDSPRRHVFQAVTRDMNEIKQLAAATTCGSESSGLRRASSVTEQCSKPQQLSEQQAKRQSPMKSYSLQEVPKQLKYSEIIQKIHENYSRTQQQLQQQQTSISSMIESTSAAPTVTVTVTTPATTNPIPAFIDQDSHDDTPVDQCIREDSYSGSAAAIATANISTIDRNHLDFTSFSPSQQEQLLSQNMATIDDAIRQNNILDSNYNRFSEDQSPEQKLNHQSNHHNHNSNLFNLEESINSHILQQQQHHQQRLFPHHLVAATQAHTTDSPQFKTTDPIIDYDTEPICLDHDEDQFDEHPSYSHQQDCDYDSNNNNEEEEKYDEHDQQQQQQSQFSEEACPQQYD